MTNHWVPEMASRKLNDNGLNSQQQLFADTYLADPDRNGTQAYMEAYPSVSAPVAKVNASRLLTHANVASYVTTRLQDITDKLQLTQEDVIRDLLTVRDIGMDPESRNLPAVNTALKLIGQHLHNMWPSRLQAPEQPIQHEHRYMGKALDFEKLRGICKRLEADVDKPH